jgi:glycosyltransferase involved in cell wall biosynthesis
MISVVIPAYNEEGAIAHTVHRVRDALQGAEVLVVDDGSSDRTAELAREAGAKVVSHPANGGYGKALKTGIAQAGHDTVVICDADGTYPVELIPRLLAEYDKGFDMVVGARTGHHYHGSRFKGPLRKVLRALVQYTAGRKVPDANSGLRVFSRRMVTGYLDTLCDTFSFTTSLTLAYVMTGRFVAHVDIPYFERVGETKVKLLHDSLKTFQYILQAIGFYNPLKFFLLVAGLCFGLSVASFAIGAATGINAPYYLGIGTLLLALLVFCLGLLAHLLRLMVIKGSPKPPA